MTGEAPNTGGEGQGSLAVEFRQRADALRFATGRYCLDGHGYDGLDGPVDLPTPLAGKKRRRNTIFIGTARWD